MKRNLTRNQKTILSVVIVLAFLILLFYYGFMIYHKFAEENFVNQSIQISDANQNPVFKIDRGKKFKGFRYQSIYRYSYLYK